MKGTKMQPTKDKVLIRLDEINNVSKSGIIVTKAWEDARNTGIIEAVGKDVDEVEIMDRVIINPYAVIETADKDVVYVRESDILSYER
jgi:co-chaperonin GroES (HSP10)